MLQVSCNQAFLTNALNFGVELVSDTLSEMVRKLELIYTEGQTTVILIIEAKL